MTTLTAPLTEDALASVIDLARGQVAIQTSWWLVTFPGLAVMFVVLTLTMLGEGLIEIINPRLRDR